MDDDSSNQEWAYSYSTITTDQAERRLDFRLSEVLESAKPIADVLRGLGASSIYETRYTKEKVYDRIVEYLKVETPPSIPSDYINKFSLNDLVYTVIAPIISDYMDVSEDDGIKIFREKEIVGVDGEIGGEVEFVVIDNISVTEEKFVLVITSGMKQLLLSMKDMRDRNRHGTIYGFTTTGDKWQMVSYDGAAWTVSEDFKLMFPRMREPEQKERWMQDFSGLIDVMYFALSDGGAVKQV